MFNIDIEDEVEDPNGDGIYIRSLRKHAYIILTPFKPHFYIVKLR